MIKSKNNEFAVSTNQEPLESYTLKYLKLYDDKTNTLKAGRPVFMDNKKTLYCGHFEKTKLDDNIITLPIGNTYKYKGILIDHTTSEVVLATKGILTNVERSGVKSFYGNLYIYISGGGKWTIGNAKPGGGIHGIYVGKLETSGNKKIVPSPYMFKIKRNQRQKLRTSFIHDNGVLIIQPAFF